VKRQQGRSLAREERNGLMTEQIDAAMAENTERYERAARAVMADPDLSDSAKEREEGALFEKARVRHEELYSRKEAEIAEEEEASEGGGDI
jgi:hypothetical protein